MTNNTSKNHFREVVELVWKLIVVTVLILVVILKVIPAIYGGSALTVYTASMEPNIKPGDIVAVIPIEEDKIQVNDIISYHPRPDDPTLITHRVIGKDKQNFIFKGDNNPSPDPNPVMPKQIAGKVMYTIPSFGFMHYLINNGMITLVLAGLLFGYAILMFLIPNQKNGIKNSKTL